MKTVDMSLQFLKKTNNSENFKIICKYTNISAVNIENTVIVCYTIPDDTKGGIL